MEGWDEQFYRETHCFLEKFLHSWKIFLHDHWLPCSGHTISSTGPSVSPFRYFSFLNAFKILAICIYNPYASSLAGLIQNNSMQLILNASWCKAGSNVGAKDRFRPLFPTKIGLKWAALCHFSKWSDDRVLAGTTWNMKYCGWQLLPAGFNWATAVSPLQEATPEGLLFSNLKCKILEFLSTTTWYGKSFNKSQNTDSVEWWLMWGLVVPM